jgi:glycosyltransferase involved in cell wall biosynthesis
MSKISIIIPNYNNGKYINDCLWSVQNQTFSNWDAIIIDDASTDNSKTIIDNYTKRDSRFHSIFFSENKGLSFVRNCGIDSSVGEHLMFLDSDDCLSVDTMTVAYNLMSKYNTDSVKFQRVKVDEDFDMQQIYGNTGNISYNHKFINAPAKSIYSWEKDLQMSVWMYLYNRDLFSDDLRFLINLAPMEDVNLNMKIIPKMKDIVITNFPGVYYRQSETSIVKSQNFYEKALLSSKIHTDDIINFFNSLNSVNMKDYKKLCMRITMDVLLSNHIWLPMERNKNLRDMAIQNIKELINQHNIFKYDELQMKLAWLFYLHNKDNLAKLFYNKSRLKWIK